MITIDEINMAVLAMFSYAQDVKKDVLISDESKKGICNRLQNAAKHMLVSNYALYAANNALTSYHLYIELALTI